MQVLDFHDALDTIVVLLAAQPTADAIGKLLIANSPGAGVTPEDKSTIIDGLFALQNNMPYLEGRDNTSPLLLRLRLQGLAAPRMVASMIAAVENARTHQNITTDLRFWSLYHSLLTVLRMRAAVFDLLVAPKLEPDTASTKIIQLEIHDYDGEGIDLDRLRQVVERIQRLYAALSEFVDSDAPEPLLAFADTGSSLNIGIKGAAKVIEAFGKVVGDAWNAVRRRKYEDHALQLDSVARTLSVVATIKASEERGEIQPETAQRLTTQITQNVLGLLDGGTAPKEMEFVVEYDRQATIRAARDVKKLKSGDSES